MNFIHGRWSWSLDLQCCEWTVQSFSNLQGSDVFAAAVMRVFARVSKCCCSRWCVSLSLLRVPPSRLIHPLLKCGGKLARHELEVQALDQRVGVLVFLLQTEGCTPRLDDLFFVSDSSCVVLYVTETMDLVITSSHATLSVFSRRHSFKVAAYLEMFGEIPRRHEARAYAMKFRRETRTWRERTTLSRE